MSLNGKLFYKSISLILALILLVPVLSACPTGTAKGGTTVDSSALSTQVSGSGMFAAQLSSTSALPFSLLTISGFGFEPTDNISVRFTRPPVFSVDIPALDATANSVTVAVPPFIDATKGSFSPGTVSVQVTRKSGTGTLTSNAINGFQIEDLPQSTAPAGTVTLGFLKAAIWLAQQNQNNIKGTSPAAAGLKMALKAQINDMGMLAGQVQDVVDNSSRTFSLKTASGSYQTIGAADLRSLDRMMLGILAAQPDHGPAADVSPYRRSVVFVSYQAGDRFPARPAAVDRGTPARKDYFAAAGGGDQQSYYEQAKGYLKGKADSITQTVKSWPQGLTVDQVKKLNDGFDVVLKAATATLIVAAALTEAPVVVPALAIGYLTLGWTSLELVTAGYLNSYDPYNPVVDELELNGLNRCLGQLLPGTVADHLIDLYRLATKPEPKLAADEIIIPQSNEVGPTVVEPLSDIPAPGEPIGPCDHSTSPPGTNSSTGVWTPGGPTSGSTAGTWIPNNQGQSDAEDYLNTQGNGQGGLIPGGTGGTSPTGMPGSDPRTWSPTGGSGGVPDSMRPGADPRTWSPTGR